ncbi:pilus assembly protein TadE [Paraburkholderia lacunae]|uniref:Pilus assembly protein TadE n=2 Tax=Paraburkholderia lacunae TaxID=2211104 RepID=A0A370N6D0_9BURK|nr:pilus assembly protein TadE [Paraburkholderia lacunae]
MLRERREPCVLHHRATGRLARYRRERGTISYVLVFFIFMALAFAAFSVDIGHYFLAQDELQTAADAAAIAGAVALNSGTSTPGWNTAVAAAASAVRLNTSDGVVLTNAAIQSGYWNLTGSPAGMQASTITPGTYDSPAVQVTVSRATGLNGGQLVFFFAPLFGVYTTAVTATAVAVVSAPGYVGPGGLFPVALGKCLLDLYWNAQTGAPKIDPSTGQAYTFQITNDALYGSCSGGQWTSFATDANDVPTVRALMSSGNPSGLSIGDSIWIEPGTKTTLYSSVPINVDVLVPVVQSLASSTETILGFAAFHIDLAVGGSGKYIQGHLITNFKVATGSGQGGPFYGAYVPPRLAQ